MVHPGLPLVLWNGGGERRRLPMRVARVQRVRRCRGGGVLVWARAGSVSVSDTTHKVLGLHHVTVLHTTYSQLTVQH